MKKNVLLEEALADRITFEVKKKKKEINFIFLVNLDRSVLTDALCTGGFNAISISALVSIFISCETDRCHMIRIKPEYNQPFIILLSFPAIVVGSLLDIIWVGISVDTLTFGNNIVGIFVFNFESLESRRY